METHAHQPLEIKQIKKMNLRPDTNLVQSRIKRKGERIESGGALNQVTTVFI